MRVEAGSAPARPSEGIVRRAKTAPRPNPSRPPPAVVSSRAVPGKATSASSIDAEASSREPARDPADREAARTAAALASGPAAVRGGGERRVFGESDVDGVAAPGERVRPRYPPRARQIGREADVDLAVLIEADGAVSEVVLARSGGEDFDREAIEAVRRERWRPATRAGVPVASRVHFRVRFRLD